MQSLEDDDPRRVGEYRLLRRLGAGGMGRVYLGRSARGRTVAVKVVRPELAGDREFRARFRREVEAARRVGGAWTAPVLDADTEGERPWVATGYVAGPSLSAAVREFGPLPEASVRALGVRLAEALAHVHALGLVHRDVKPSNVLLTPDGPRLIDFGIARALAVTSTLTGTGNAIGSPGFMSPEQARGEQVGPASDVFSLAAVLAYAATGELPYGEGTAPVVLLYRVLHEYPRLLAMSDSLRRNLLDCLAKDPAARPSPQLLRAWLDDDGEATRTLTNGSWLPSRVAAAIGRAAAQLLDLEADRTGTTRTAVPEPPSAPPRATVPPPRPAPAEPLRQPTAPTKPVPTRPWPLPPQPIPVYAPSGHGPRGRRGVLVLVAVVMAVLLVAVWGYAVKDRTTATSTTGSASGNAPAPQLPAGGNALGGDRVPVAYLGTWSGPAVHPDHTPAGVVTLTVGQGAIGDESTRSRLDNGATRCEAVWKLTEVSATSLTYTSRLVRSTPSGACAAAASTDLRVIVLELDGSIHYGVAHAGVVTQAAVLRKTA